MDRLRRRLGCCALVAVGVVGLGVAQDSPRRPLPTATAPAATAGRNQEVPKAPERKPGDVVVLRLAPKEEPVPAFRYRLLPTAGELHAGNAVPGYLQLMTPNTLGNLITEAEQARVKRLLAAPPAELRGQEHPWFRAGQVVRRFDAAARSTYADWNLEGVIREHHLGTLLPELQDFRSVGQLMALRARHLVAVGDWPGALEAFKTGFAMARHAAGVPTLINGIVATAMAHEMLDQLEAAVQQPGAPNLYWALADLPEPLVEFRLGYQGERWFAELIFRDVLDEQDPAATRVLGARETDAILATLRQALRGTPEGNPGAEFDVAAAVARSAGSAREQLRAFGVPAGTVKAMSDAQAFCGGALLSYHVTYDRLRKTTVLPYEAAAREQRRILEELKAGRASGDGVKAFTAMFLPAIEKTTQVDLRLRQRVAALRVVEALRLHAARAGKWPEALAEIKEVPVPNDPFTEKTFAYQLNGKVGTLRSHETEGPVRINYRLELGR